MVDCYGRMFIVLKGCKVKARGRGRRRETWLEVTKNTDVRVGVAACLRNAVVAGPVPVVAVAIKSYEMGVVVDSA